MDATSPQPAGLLKQHLIDPEICIRCGTCEETCPIDAVSHNDDNYVVDAEICNYCMDCIAPCPTGSIDNWRVVKTAYSVDEQFGWDELPEQGEFADDVDTDLMEALEDEIAALLADAHSGTGGKAVAPASAAKPTVNLFNRSKPANAVVQGNFRLTEEDAENDVRHIILDLGDTVFPVLEGQSIGIIAPGTDANGNAHAVRLYSVSSPRDGERPNTNNMALTVKREAEGICSNYLCDLEKGASVQITGPFGATFLMPEDPQANIFMICTGTGSAPFRAFTERRRRAMSTAPGQMDLYFGARRPEELPYFGPLKKVPQELMRQQLVFSRLPDSPKEYVQDRMVTRAEEVSALLADEKTHVYICGLRGMETGVDESFASICRQASLDWEAIKPRMREEGRYHVETY